MTNADALNRTLFIADNLDVLRGIDSDSIDLIATDPPFNKGVTAFTGITKAGAEVSYKDVWTWGDVQQEWADRIRVDHPSLYGVVMTANTTHSEGMGAFLSWLGVRVLEMHRVLKPTGSLYLHCDHTASAYIKQMLDAVFDPENFRNEIIWCYSGGGQPSRDFPRRHDTIFRYSKTRTYLFNGDAARVPYDSDYRATVFVGEDTRAPGRTYTPNPKGKVVEDWWRNIPRPYGKEIVGYPTQKPLALYERIIGASSNPGDLVLDPFAGCATTCVAAEGLQRRWIGIDINDEAGEVLRSRLQLAQGNGNHPVRVLTEPPVRTDDGEAAAPELVLVAQYPQAPRLTARELRERLILMDGRKCQGCGWTPHHAEYLVADHKVPKSRGGSDDIRNRVLLCTPCNGAKSNKLTLAELRERRIEEDRMQDSSWTREWYERTGRFA